MSGRNRNQPPFGSQRHDPPRFAPVAPPHILMDMFQRDPRHLFGPYHLFLAHLTVEREQEFQELLACYEAVLPFDPLTIIMDNSIVELGGVVPTKVMKQAVEICQNRNVARGSTHHHKIIPVLPDVMGDTVSTIDVVVDAYPVWMKEVPHDHGFMIVAQGTNWDEFTRLIDCFFVHHKEEYEDITWVGIPRKIQQTWGDATRRHAVEYVQTVAPQAKIHLLGFSDSIWDDVICAQMGVEGIDSAVPLRYPSKLTPMSIPDRRDKDWFQSGKFIYQIHGKNVINVRSWISM